MLMEAMGAHVVVVEVGGDGQRRTQQQAQPHQTVPIVPLEIVSQKYSNQELEEREEEQWGLINPKPGARKTHFIILRIQLNDVRRLRVQKKQDGGRLKRGR